MISYFHRSLIEKTLKTLWYITHHVNNSNILFNNLHNSNETILHFVRILSIYKITLYRFIKLYYTSYKNVCNHEYNCNPITKLIHNIIDILLPMSVIEGRTSLQGSEKIYAAHCHSHWAKRRRSGIVRLNTRLARRCYSRNFCARYTFAKKLPGLR